MYFNNCETKKRKTMYFLLSTVVVIVFFMGSFSMLGNMCSTAEASAWNQEPTDVQWNTRDLDIATNGNILVAGKILAGMDDEKFQSRITQVFVGSVNKSPWKYYGQVIAFPGEVAVIQEYPPQSDISNWIANGGECAEIVLVTNEGVIVDALVIGSTGNINVGDYITVNGFPVGKVDAPNQLGGTTNELVVVGKI